MFKSVRNSVISSVLLAACFVTGCGQHDVLGRGDLVDRTNQALSVGSLLEINGTFGAGCTQRSGDWSVGLGDFSSLTHSPLSVLLNDAACTLSLTSIRAGSQIADALYFPPAPIPLSAGYQLSGSPFRKMPMDAPAFFANTRILPDMSFAQDFVLQSVYSQDPSATSLSRNADFAVVYGGAMAVGVPQPDYGATATNMSFQVDALKIVHSVAGQVDLTAQLVGGQSYVIDLGTLGEQPAYAQVDAVYSLGSPVALSGINPSIPATAFGLVGQPLLTPVQRNIVIANEVSGVRSYQIISITFGTP